MGMTFYAGRVTETEHGKVIEPVIPFEAHNPEIITYPENWDGEVIRRPNPAYIADAAMDLSNANARAVVEALGFDADDECFSLEIGAVIAACTRWQAKANFAASPEVPVSEEQGALGCRMVDLGRPEGYLNDRIATLHRMAVEGRKRGATLISVA